MKNILEIEHLSLSLPSRKGMVPILHDVNLHVGEGKSWDWWESRAAANP